MGKALYREYRPLSFDDVKGQEHITDTLKNALKKGAISHAYLFTGPKGVGKTSVARILAHEVNNLKYDEEETHLDIIEIDAASNRRIDEIRDLRDKVHIAPTSAKYKVYIIDEVHMLTREAFNALLKTLEEPPEHAIFILATTEAHKVPDTIQSRTQRYTFRSVTGDPAVEHLRTIAKKEKLNISDEALVLLAEHGGGSFRDSISMLDQIAGFKHTKITEKEVSELLGVPSKELLEDLLQSIVQNDVASMFVAVESLRTQGMHPTKTAQALITTLRKQLHGEQQEHQLQPKRAIELMKNLLPLTGLHGSFEALEIALLDSLELNDVAELGAEKSTKPAKTLDTKATVKETKKTTIAPVEEPEELEEPETAKAETKDNTDITAASAAIAPGSWNEVLQTLKKTHNTLYGVLRMAETKTSNDTITLIFQFEFHKKQLMQDKNIQTLKTIVKDTLGSNYVIEASVKKKQSASANTTKLVAEPVDNEDLVSVSNIFGGAELLE